LKTAILSR